MVKHYDKHVDTGCSEYLHITVKGLLTKPLSEPLNKIDLKAKVFQILEQNVKRYNSPTCTT